MNQTVVNPDISPVSGEAAHWLNWLDARLDRERTALILVLSMGALLFLPFLGTLGLWDPWETHYGEVARAMIARDDYVYPYWESAYFFSKPALSLWMMALGMFVTGAESSAPGEALGSWVVWGMRLPFALIAIAMMWAVYRIGRQIWGRSAGVLCALVLASCPQFIFIGKQAITDGPLVGLMTCGMACFVVAVFDDEEDRPATLRERILSCAGILMAVLPQLLLIGREMKSTKDIILLVGVGLIALGSGGIKPCVSANVGDQFGKGNWHLVERVFQAFYWIINFGSFFATLAIPWLRKEYGNSVAFGLPGVLMLIATLIFWMGRHKFVHAPPKPGGKLGWMDTLSSTLLFLAIGHLFFTASWPAWQILLVSVAFLVAGFMVFQARQRIQPDNGFLAVMFHWFKTS
ncbi:MAG TPA: phospholipid carrier-dependent glycosyltransferase, partial [Myxococcales bacterium]|nr:phospholipid carrier-dependent glycosyltransferase [Myxococcales bacterium]